MSELDAPAPDAVQILTEHFNDVKDNLVGYLLSGLGFYGAIVIAVLVVMVPLFAATLPGIVMENDTLMIGGMIIGWTWYLVALLAVTLVISPLLLGSFLRAMDAHKRGAAPLGFKAAFSTFRQDPKRTIGIQLVVQLIMGVGMMFCYIPGMLAIPFMSFAVPMVVLDGHSISEALSRTWAHMRRYPLFHLLFHLLALATAMAVEMIPIVGLLMVFPWLFGLNLVAYRAAFSGEGGA